MPVEQIAERDPVYGESEDAVIMRREAGAIPLMPAAPQVRETKARFRLNLPIMVLAFRDNRQVAVTIQAGEIFEVLGPAQDDRFVVVEVKGEQFLVFDCDLNDRRKFVPHRNTRTAVHAAVG